MLFKVFFIKHSAEKSIFALYMYAKICFPAHRKLILARKFIIDSPYLLYKRELNSQNKKNIFIELKQKYELFKIRK